ncbi:hypothetical protein [Nakamurella multipartita]|jgi:hypothetical protein|uniref:FHA domain-containing protein n=1 Tax=Nakamurella multipartita (strain ATCC 700099 / DSM 44233 / CIP 104796 / JCM 9543 / NBRC 105858 / Y-104) TaxID=479431 RepID=C8X837_NAKMY|nr:hypothetical protein [Nakamurella multipartita]ACV77013.1 FHA domain-containing protein [Nakamurella multipartita DSM 44233]
MTDQDRTPDASADVRERAGATEDYGGVPISDAELAQVWMSPDAAEAAGAADPDNAESAGAPESEPPADESAAAAQGAVTRPEVPADDPAPAEPA